MASRPVRTKVSIHRERMPPPGVRRKSWSWEDVFNTPYPARARRRKEGAFVVRHGGDDRPDSAARLGYVTLVAVSAEGNDWDIVVEERIDVETRVLTPVIRAERAVARRLERGTQAGARIVWDSSQALGTRVGGKGGAAVQRGGGAIVAGIAWLTRTLTDGLRSVVEAPDKLYAGADTAGAHLRGRHERRAIVRGLGDPHSLSREGKAAALFLVSMGLILTAVAATLIVYFAAPQYLGTWRAIVTYFAIGVGSTVLFPFFPELQFADVAAAAGPIGALASIVLGMTVGAWLVLFLGDAIHGTLRKSAKPGSPLARVLEAAERHAKRHGFWLAAIILAIPYGPDTPVFYTLATARTPTRLYIAGAFVGILTRFSIVWALSGVGF